MGLPCQSCVQLVDLGRLMEWMLVIVLETVQRVHFHSILIYILMKTNIFSSSELFLSGCVKQLSIWWFDTGYFCPAASTSAQQTICPAGYFVMMQGCLRSFNSFTSNYNISCDRSYCPVGSVSDIKCPAGVYGFEVSLNSSSCSGYCRPGTITSMAWLNIKLTYFFLVYSVFRFLLSYWKYNSHKHNLSYWV